MQNFRFSSFPRQRESSKLLERLDTRFHGYDDTLFISESPGLMNIRIEDLDLMDFSEVVDPTADRLPLIHPGETLHEDFLKPLGLSQYALAKAIGVPPRRINEIIKGQRGITVDTALRLAAFFGTDSQSWLNLQSHYDTERVRDTLTDVLSRIPRCERLAA